MNKGRKIIYSFTITSAMWLAIITALVIVALFLLSKINEYYAEPFSRGLVPEIGLGIKFASKDLDLMIEKYSIYLQDMYGTPQYYENVKAKILDNYTLVNDTYYYNMYLNSGVEVLVNINLIPFIIVSSCLFIVSIILLILCYRRNSKDKIRMTKPFGIVMIVLSYLSCNVYAVYKFMKGYKEIS